LTDRNCIVVYTVWAYVGLFNKTHIFIGWNQQH